MIDLRAPTVVAALDGRRESASDAVAVHVVDAEGRSHPWTVAQLMSRVHGFARQIPRAENGEIVAVCLHHGLDLHAAFLGAMWAGHVPTVIAPPSPRMEGSKYVRSLTAIVAHVKPRWLIVDAQVRSALSDALGADAHTTILEPGSVPSVKYSAPWPARETDIALLQHSSGTTGLQKGVALRHGDIMRHMRAYSAALDLTDRDIIASWLPLYHDMGLMACFLMPLVAGIPWVTMSALDWVETPRRFLDKIDQHRATLCWMPNFAYGFLSSVAAREPQPVTRDLSSVRAWVNCSEPVSASAHRKFLGQFAASGVREASLTTSYAMAENVFAVTQSRAGHGKVLRADREQLTQHDCYCPAGPAGDAIETVSNGSCITGTQLRVRSATGLLAQPGHVGEMEIRGEHLFSGYWKRSDLTAVSMTPDGWYRTGDLGFVLDENVYVTGRLKDVIIIQGRNLYLTDIEETVSELAGVTKGRVVAFGVNDVRFDTEGLVVVAESHLEHAADRAQLALSIRTHVAQHLDCTPIDVRIFAERWLVKSTSGKLARADNRSKYLAETPE